MMNVCCHACQNTHVMYLDGGTGCITVKATCWGYTGCFVIHSSQIHNGVNLNLIQISNESHFTLYKHFIQSHCIILQLGFEHCSGAVFCF